MRLPPSHTAARAGRSCAVPAAACACVQTGAVTVGQRRCAAPERVAAVDWAEWQWQNGRQSGADARTAAPPARAREHVQVTVCPPAVVCRAVGGSSSEPVSEEPPACTGTAGARAPRVRESAAALTWAGVRAAVRACCRSFVWSACTAWCTQRTSACAWTRSWRRWAWRPRRPRLCVRAAGALPSARPRLTPGGLRACVDQHHRSVRCDRRAPAAAQRAGQRQRVASLRQRAGRHHAGPVCAGSL